MLDGIRQEDEPSVNHTATNLWPTSQTGILLPSKGHEHRSQCCASLALQMTVLCKVAYPVHFPSPLRTRRLTHSRFPVNTRALPNFPRILEEIPIRRLSPRADHSRVFDLTNKELSRILSPASGTTPELLTGTSLLFAVIIIAVALEFLQRSFQSVHESSLPGEYTHHGRKEQRQPQQTRIATAAQQEKLLRRQIITYEKFRGLRWLAIVTALVVWSTGVLNKDNPLQP